MRYGREYIAKPILDKKGSYIGIEHMELLIRCKNCESAEPIDNYPDILMCKENNRHTPTNGYCYWGRKKHDQTD